MKPEIEEFCRYLAIERNVSPHTLDAYRTDLEMFRVFLVGESGSVVPVEGVTHLMVRRYLARLSVDHAKSTLGRKLAAIRSFFKYLVRQGKIRKNPAELVSTPKKEKNVPYHLDIDEITALVTAPAGNELLALRDRVILETLYSSGLRVGELTRLDVGAVDLEEGLVRVLGKGGKERIVPLGGPARSAIGNYLVARKNPPREAPFLVNARGGRLTSRSVAR
ncbi:MAG TPA: site-specific integrase, partial [Geobacteraceae bacterium]|nr:site-specific integrase [Geobacteraceae bacterium]